MIDRTDPSVPDTWERIETIDAHAAGEPLRVVVDDLALEGETILDRRRYMREHLDHVRTALVYEPRGHADMYGAVLTDPVSPDADLGVLFLHNEGYSTMCGHGVIALGTVLPEAGMLPAEPPEETIVMDTPAGPVTARAAIEDGRVAAVSFENVPSFVSARDRTVDVPSLGTVPYDVAFGGAFYAYVDAAEVGIALTPGNVDALVDAGMAIKRAVSRDLDVEHPTDDDLGFLYGTIFTGPAEGERADSRNVCVFADGQVDRSPTGTGVSGRLALRHARGELAVGQDFVVESVIGTRFTGRITETTSVGDTDAVVPEVTGSAHITGHNEFVIDPDDPLGDGFLLR